MEVDVAWEVKAMLQDSPYKPRNNSVGSRSDRKAGAFLSNPLKAFIPPPVTL